MPVTDIKGKEVRLLSDASILNEVSGKITDWQGRPVTGSDPAMQANFFAFCLLRLACRLTHNPAQAGKLLAVSY